MYIHTYIHTCIHTYVCVSLSLYIYIYIYRFNYIYIYMATNQVANLQAPRLGGRPLALQGDHLAVRLETVDNYVNMCIQMVIIIAVRLIMIIITIVIKY